MMNNRANGVAGLKAGGKWQRAIHLVWLACLVALPGFSTAMLAAQKDQPMNDEFLSAVIAGKAAQVKAMLKTDAGLIRAADKNGTSAVLLAVYYRQPEVAEVLLGTGVDLNIFEAAATGRTDRVRALIDKDARLVEAYAADGFYPLGLAVFFGHSETARLLVERHADVNQAARNAFAVAPLHAALAGGQPSLVEEFLARGADVNARQQLGFTPLHEAAHSDDVEMARLLLDGGADPSITADDGRDSAKLAADEGNERVAALLSG
jgi:ankyrin repeat protein